VELPEPRGRQHSFFEQGLSYVERFPSTGSCFSLVTGTFFRICYLDIPLQLPPQDNAQAKHFAYSDFFEIFTLREKFFYYLAEIFEICIKRIILVMKEKKPLRTCIRPILFFSPFDRQRVPLVRQNFVTPGRKDGEKETRGPEREKERRCSVPAIVQRALRGRGSTGSAKWQSTHRTVCASFISTN